MKGTCNGRHGCDRNPHGFHGLRNVDRPLPGRNGRRSRGPAGRRAMSADAIMWLVLLIAGIALFGYLLAVLIHPDKW
ncbi:hypothetical protein Arth_1874 [Arthrobacter sp. FB24]|nr:hypothetical protein Arth_1874 [Arthrobacter sp. FB24]